MPALSLSRRAAALMSIATSIATSLAMSLAILGASTRVAAADPDTGSAGSANAGSASAGSNASDFEALFEEGRTLARQGDFAGACDRFQRALAIDPSALGTAFNLADCYEKRAMTSRAWHLFDRSARRAADSGDTVRAKFARERADKLVVQLAHVDLHIASPRPSNLAITINGDPVDLPAAGPGAAATDVHELADPGTIVVVATADLQAAIRSELRAAAGATVSVPIQAAPAPISLHARPLPDEVSSRDHRNTAWVGAAIAAGVLGAASLGYGLAQGYSARTNHDHALDDGCHQTSAGLVCPAAAAGLESSAVSQANQATVFTLIGAGLVAGGAAVFLLAPQERDREHVAIAPIAGNGEIGVALAGGF